jgi:TusA-related sulfurtransferase
MALGETLEVVADDPAAEADIKSLVKRLGHVLVDVDSRDRVTRILIQKAT